MKDLFFWLMVCAALFITVVVGEFINEYRNDRKQKRIDERKKAARDLKNVGGDGI